MKPGATPEEAREAAREEVIAEAVPTIFTDENYIRQIVNEDRTLGQKIKDALENCIKVFRELVEKMTLRNYEDAVNYATENKRGEIRALIENTEALQKIANQFETAMSAANEAYDARRAQARETARAQQTQTQETEELAASVKYSVQQMDDGTPYVGVDTDQHIFDGLTANQALEKATVIIKDRFQKQYLGPNKDIYISRKAASEYGHPKKKHGVPDNVLTAKARASTELDNLIEAGDNYRTAPNGSNGHVNSNALGGFKYYDTIFRLGKEYFKGKVNIAVTNKGRLFHDVTQLENATQDITNQYGNNPYVSFLSDTSMHQSIAGKNGNVNEEGKNSLKLLENQPKFSMKQPVERKGKREGGIHAKAGGGEDVLV